MTILIYAYIKLWKIYSVIKICYYNFENLNIIPTTSGNMKLYDHPVHSAKRAFKIHPFSAKGTDDNYRRNDDKNKI